MLLRENEFDFLDAFAFETTNRPFTGPATEALHRLGLVQSEIGWILAAYNEDALKRGKSPLGTLNSQPPPIPWSTRAKALERDGEVGAQLKQLRDQSSTPSGRRG